MADATATTLPNYPAATTLDGSELVPIWQNNKQCSATADQLLGPGLDQMNGYIADAESIAAGIVADTTAAGAAQVALAVTAQQAAAAYAGSAGVLNAYLAPGGAVPFTVSGIALGSTGSGATVSGWFDLIVSGGPLGHRARVKVSGGSIVDADVPRGGLSTSNAAPTYTLPTITGLAGATAPTATVSALGNGATFEALSSNYASALLWTVTGGALAAVTGPDSNQMSRPLSAALTAVINSLSAPNAQIIGRPITPVSGTAASSSGILMGDPVGQACTLTSIVFVARATGTFTLNRYTKSGTTYTKVATYTASVSATGPTTLTPASFGQTSIGLNAADYLQVSGNSMWDLTSATTADGAGWSITGALSAATISNPSFSAAGRMEIQINLAFQNLTGAAFQTAQSQIAAMQPTVSSNAVAVALLYSTLTQVIGRPVTPVSGTGVSQGQVLMRDVVANTGVLGSIVFVALTTGTFTLVRYSVSGSTYTKIASYTATVSAAGLTTLTPSSFGQTSIPLNAGEAIQVSGSMMWGVTATTADGTGWSTSGSLGASTISSPSWSTGARLEIQINCAYQAQTVTAAALTALQATAAANAAAITALQATATDNAAGVALLRQSGAQIIGRPSTPITGSAASQPAVLFRDVVNASAISASLTSVVAFPLVAGTYTLVRYSVSGTTYTKVATYTATIAAGEVGTAVTLTPARFGQTAIPLNPGEAIQVSGGSMMPVTTGTADGLGWSTSAGLAATTISNPAWSTAAILQVQINIAYAVQPVTAQAVITLQSQVAPLVQPNPALWAAAAEIVHFIIYGQSLSRGQCNTLNNTTALTYALRWNGGVRSDDGGSDVAANHASFTGLKETSSAPNAETPASGMARMLAQLFLADGIDVTSWNRAWLFSAPGQGATAASGLIPGTGPFTRLTADITYAPAAAATYGKPTYAPQLVCYEQGQQDYAAGTSATVWANLVEQIRTGVQSQAQTTASQPSLVMPMLLSQVSSHLQYSVAYPNIALQQLALHTNQYYCVACPEYPLPPYTASPPHLTASGYEWMGAYWAVAYYNWIIKGVKPKAMAPISVVRNGNSLIATYPVATGKKLVIDTTQVAAQTNYGFSVVNASGSPVTISNARLVGNNQIAFDCASTPAAGWLLRAGFTDTSGGTVFGKTNLRDNAGDTLTYVGSATLGTVAMHNWALCSETPVT